MPQTDPAHWPAFRPPARASDAPLDLSFLNEKPAGARGFVTVRDGHFAFADGTVIRFWGTNLVGPAVFMERTRADQVAVRMAKLGINLVRLHFLDHSWGGPGLFNPEAGHTRDFDPASLDRLEYLVSVLKKNGIYVYPDFLVGRRFREGDGVPGFEGLEDGAKTVAHFSRRVIELNKRYVERLLTHVNPHTGLALKDDPAFLGSEIVNESSLLCGSGGRELPPPFQRELQDMYEAWGGRGGVVRFRFDPETRGLCPVGNPEWAGDSLRFLLEKRMETDREMKAFVAGLSPHALLAGSNLSLPVPADIRADAQMDFMDAHAYWDHPQVEKVGGGWAEVALAPFHNRSQLAAPSADSLPAFLSARSVLGKPLLVTGWNDCFPNEYRLEGPVLMAAYGCLQDWGGMLQFDYGPALIGSERMGPFSINARPDNEPFFQLGALLFRKGLLRASETVLEEPLCDEQVLSGEAAPSRPPWLPYVARVVQRFTGPGRKEAPAFSGMEKFHDAGAGVVRSSTGEQTLDYGRGVLRIDAPCAQGFTGALGTGEPWRARDLSAALSPSNPWGSVLAVSLDGRPLGESGRLVVAAAGRAENTGQVFNESRTALEDPGRLPLRLEGLEAEITLRIEGGDRVVRPLDESGNPGGPVRSEVRGGVLRFRLSPGDGSRYYLVEPVQAME
jgi:hypothetical protein